MDALGSLIEREHSPLTPDPGIFALVFLVDDSSGDEKGKKQNTNDAEEGEVTGYHLYFPDTILEAGSTNCCG